MCGSYVPFNVFEKLLGLVGSTVELILLNDIDIDKNVDNIEHIELCKFRKWSSQLTCTVHKQKKSKVA